MKGRRKYGNKEVWFAGTLFQSTKERDRYIFLLQQEEKGLIYGLKKQVPFELLPQITKDVVIHLKTKDKTVTREVQKPTHYTCDFLYYKSEDGLLVVEDVKGSRKTRTKEYQLKKKMMLALKGIAIKEVYNPTEDV